MLTVIIKTLHIISLPAKSLIMTLGLSMPRKSAARLPDRLDMTIVVCWGVDEIKNIWSVTFLKIVLTLKKYGMGFRFPGNNGHSSCTDDLRCNW